MLQCTTVIECADWVLTSLLRSWPCARASKEAARQPARRQRHHPSNGLWWTTHLPLGMRLDVAGSTLVPAQGLTWTVYCAKTARPWAVGQKQAETLIPHKTVDLPYARHKPAQSFGRHLDPPAQSHRRDRRLIPHDPMQHAAGWAFNYMCCIEDKHQARHVCCAHAHQSHTNVMQLSGSARVRGS